MTQLSVFPDAARIDSHHEAAPRRKNRDFAMADSGDFRTGRAPSVRPTPAGVILHH